jgi:hypothetical protein
MSHLLASGVFGMIFEHFQNYFHSINLTNGFPQLFQLCFHITQGHIPPQIARVLGATRFLAMTKAFRWSSFHYSGRNIVLTHKPRFMPLILQSFCDTFFPTPILNCN